MTHMELKHTKGIDETKRCSLYTSPLMDKIKKLINDGHGFNEMEVEKMRYICRQFVRLNFSWVINEEERVILTTLVEDINRLVNEVGPDVIIKIFDEPAIIDYVDANYRPHVGKLLYPSNLLGMMVHLLKTEGNVNVMKNIVQSTVIDTELRHVKHDDFEFVLCRTVDGFERALWQNWTKTKEYVLTSILMGSVCLLRKSK
ncbi:hypothetical protein ACOME3_008163 [Neoechinorhynchus agilis]